MSASLPPFDRDWFVAQFRRLLTGWHQALTQTSDSGVVWETPDGVRTESFLSIGGKQCDGVTRMMPALAAWSALPDSPQTITLDDGQPCEPRQLLHNIFTHAFDPEHPYYWDEPLYGRSHGQQRQVESSIVAWSLWLSRDWLLPMLEAKHIQQIQRWLEATTRLDVHNGNWALFVAVNEAARYALRAHGFAGELDRIRKVLLPLEFNRLPDGWTWDRLGRGIDYYNYWVYGSHDIYLHAMLGEEAPQDVNVALQAFAQRERDLPYLIDAAGRNVLFGRSLPYRWGWLTGAVAAQYTGLSQLAPGLVRHMLGRNLQHWLESGSLNERGVLRERLYPNGSDGGRSGYINGGHTYWGMQAMLCLAMPEQHPFWREPLEPLPIEQGDFLEARRGPGLVFQGLARTGEVRMWNLRNHAMADNALYGKYVYATEFPANSLSLSHLSLGDTQLLALLPDGTTVAAREVSRVDTSDPHALELAMEFIGGDLTAAVLTRIEIDGETYRTFHRIDVAAASEGTRWIEGGFALGLDGATQPQIGCDGLHAWARNADKMHAIHTRSLEGWTGLTIDDSLAVARAVGMALPEDAATPHIVHGRAVHALLSMPAQVGRARTAAEHSAKAGRE